MSTARPIYLDITETYWSDLRTGIQRVVRCVSSRHHLITRRTGRPCIPVVWCDDRFVDANRILRAKRRAFAEGLEYLLESWAASVQRRLENGFSRHSPIYRAARAMWRTLRTPMMAAVTQLQIAPADQPSIEFESGDVLVLLDAYWGQYGRNAARKAIAQPANGVQVFVVAYDLFPLTHADLFSKGDLADFRQAFNPTFSAVSGVLAISHAVGRGVRDYLQAHHPRLSHKPISVFHLGADIPKPPRGAQANVRPLVAQLAARRGFYLCVGTLEPRKGYHHVLDAFEQRWRNDSHVELCIVGRLGWKYEADLHRIQSNPLLNQRLFLLNDATDAEVALLYQKCRATILASQTEGFGLPMVEAMAAGAPVIANDIPIFREIADAYPLYYERTAERMNLAIDEMERRIAAGARSVPHRWLTWNESVVQFADALTSLISRCELSTSAQVEQAWSAD